MARKDAKFCKDVRDKAEKWQSEYFKDNITNYHKWFNFVMGNQWEDNEEVLLRRYSKTPLVMNKLSPLAKHILGEQRQNTPSLQVIPDEDADVQTVNTRDALIKQIMFSSDAKVVKQTAFQQALVGGFGAWFVDTDYVNNKSFDQEPKPTAVRDATKCYWDVSAITPNKTDGMYSGIIYRMSRAAFKQKYGKKLAAAIGDNYGQLDTKFVWSNADEIAICRHWEREIVKDTLYELSNGERITEDELNKSTQKLHPEDGAPENANEAEVIIRNGEMVKIEKERTLYKDKITVYKCAGDYVIEESDYAADELGMIFVDQNSWWDKQGKQICVPYFKDAYDAQRYLNYLATQSAYIWKVARYDQFMASKANVKTPETQKIWRDPATYQGALVYDVDLEGGTKPERLTPPELPQSFITQYQRALDDIHSSTGIYGTQLGQQGAELSGAAVDARTRQGSYVSYVVYDSLNRAIATEARIINQMIPRLFDTERDITIDMPDRGLQKVKINQTDEYGNIIGNKLSEGEYKIRLLPGPSFEGQQAQSIESMNVVLQADQSGQVFPLIADLYVDNLTLNNKIEFKNRLRTIVPPEIIQAGKTGQAPPPKPPQPDPMMIAAQAKMTEANAKAGKLQQDREKYMMEYNQKMQALDVERVEAAAQLQEQEMRYMSEMHKTQSDEQIAHANNIAKILTHMKHPVEPNNGGQ